MRDCHLANCITCKLSFTNAYGKRISFTCPPVGCSDVNLSYSQLFRYCSLSHRAIAGGTTRLAIIFRILGPFCDTTSEILDTFFYCDMMLFKSFLAGIRSDNDIDERIESKLLSA